MSVEAEMLRVVKGKAGAQTRFSIENGTPSTTQAKIPTDCNLRGRKSALCKCHGEMRVVYGTPAAG